MGFCIVLHFWEVWGARVSGVGETDPPTQCLVCELPVMVGRLSAMHLDSRAAAVWLCQWYKRR